MSDKRVSSKSKGEQSLRVAFFLARRVRLFDVGGTPGKFPSISFEETSRVSEALGSDLGALMSGDVLAPVLVTELHVSTHLWKSTEVFRVEIQHSFETRPTRETC